MKSLYWRPQRISLRVLLLITFVGLCGFAAVETFRVKERQPGYAEKMRAAQLALRAFEVIREARVQLGQPIDLQTDPSGSGLIGNLISPVTTNTGHLPAKQTSVNPNFAAVVVELLSRAKVSRGDTVAVGLSGSFPALNIATLAAIETMGLKPLIITSLGASQWGANLPSFTWLDIESALIDARVWSFRSLAASPGGIDDRALGLSKEGRELLAEAIEHSGAKTLKPQSYTESLDQRMALYREQAGESEIRAYINVGGGTVSVGTRAGKLHFKPGLNRTAPRGPTIDSVMSRFADRGVPVIHLIKIDELAQRYQLPLQPRTMPPVGEGTIFVRESYNRWLTGAVLLVLLLLLTAMLRLDLGQRLLAANRAPNANGAEQPEPMV